MQRSRIVEPLRPLRVFRMLVLAIVLPAVLLAAVLPALRAARVDPLAVLRNE